MSLLSDLLTCYVTGGSSKPVVPIWGDLATPGDTWQSLETLLFVLPEVGVEVNKYLMRLCLTSSSHRTAPT